MGQPLTPAKSWHALCFSHLMRHILAEYQKGAIFMADLKNKRVITAAVCGSWPTKDMNPAVPYSPQEIAREAYECWQVSAVS